MVIRIYVSVAFGMRLKPSQALTGKTQNDRGDEVLSDMTSSYCTVYVGNLPDGVTDEQLCGRFKRAVRDREVTRTEVVCKAGKPLALLYFV